jgi:hypothetical protein
MTLRRTVLAGLILALVASAGASGRVGLVSGAELPARLDDAEFWRLVDGFSEPNGFFRSDNLVSNEDTFQFVIPTLVATVRPGGVYVGVGPDQNFTYIAAVRPRLAFIADIRRGNLHLHLMYKALFEQSADRAEFLSRLFSRPRPDGLGPRSTPDQLFGAFADVPPSREDFDRNLGEIVAWLTEHHRGPLSDVDIAGVTSVFGRFYAAGPYLRYSNSQSRWRSRYPSFQDLQLSDDGHGTQRGYLASEDAFGFVKQFQERNLLVPLVGNFAGPTALRSVGTYVKARGATISTFYTSNVEQYLFQDGVWSAFAENLAALPFDASSTLIRSCFNNCSNGGFRSWSLLDSLPSLIEDARAGRIQMYWDVLARSR